MSGVSIYMEGGGDSAGSKKRLRAGMNGFLRELKDGVEGSRRKWLLVPCGSRQEAYRKFCNAREHPKEGEIIVLLVDAESPVSAPTPVEHLQMRQEDRWNLAGVQAEHVHLMVQQMETWIAADREALEAYYGQRFKSNALPRAIDLEKVAKNEVTDALERATCRTQKGSFHKILHAPDLLVQINPEKVRKRCRHCKRLFDTLRSIIRAL